MYCLALENKTHIICEFAMSQALGRHLMLGMAIVPRTLIFYQWYFCLNHTVV